MWVTCQTDTANSTSSIRLELLPSNPNQEDIFFGDRPERADLYEEEEIFLEGADLNERPALKELNWKHLEEISPSNQPEQ